MNRQIKEASLKKNTLFMSVLFVVIASFFVSRYFYQLVLIQGDSMSPTLNNLNIVIIDKNNKDINRNDIVVAQIDNIKTPIIKRVVGIPNDKLIIKDNKLYVNYNLSDYYSNNDFKFGGIIENKEITLKENEYFLIGDNIEKSIDSRYDEIGIINKDNIIGKIIK